LLVLNGALLTLPVMVLPVEDLNDFTATDTSPARVEKSGRRTSTAFIGVGMTPDAPAEPAPATIGMSAADLQKMLRRSSNGSLKPLKGSAMAQSRRDSYDGSSTGAASPALASEGIAARNFRQRRESVEKLDDPDMDIITSPATLATRNSFIAPAMFRSPSVYMQGGALNRGMLLESLKKDEGKGHTLPGAAAERYP
jgi:hypothetical protein